MSIQDEMNKKFDKLLIDAITGGTGIIHTTESVTLDDMLKNIQELEKEFPTEKEPNWFNHWKGFHIQTSDFLDEKKPKIQISENFKWLTPEARARHNKFLLDTFGYEKSVAYFRPEYSAVIMHPKTVSILKDITT